MTILTLPQAQREILAHSRPGTPETVTLDLALGRIPATAVRARLAVPSFPQSCRDGYALRRSDLRRAETTAAGLRLAVIGEIAAGRTRPAARLAPGQAYRIMTGGLLPPGADLVLPFEAVHREEEDWIVLKAPDRQSSHIRPIGCELRRHQIIVRAGRPVTPDHLPRLATAGVGELAVYPRPRVGLLCTGSELLPNTSENPAPGSLISGNRFLLAGLVRRAGGVPVDLGTVRDDPDAIAAILSDQSDQAGQTCHNRAELGQADANQTDRQDDSWRDTGPAPNLQVIITTGGMGPGRHDLVSGVLQHLQARLFYRELHLRPGRATMAAMLGPILFFGLPGPPPAVHLLFHLLIAPALRRLQGHHRPRPAPLTACLQHHLQLRRGGMQQLKDAVLGTEKGGLQVRLAEPGESINAILLVPANRRQLRAGEMVRVLPLDDGLQKT